MKKHQRPMNKDIKRLLLSSCITIIVIAMMIVPISLVDALNSTSNGDTVSPSTDAQNIDTQNTGSQVASADRYEVLKLKEVKTELNNAGRMDIIVQEQEEAEASPKPTVKPSENDESKSIRAKEKIARILDEQVDSIVEAANTVESSDETEDSEEVTTETADTETEESSTEEETVTSDETETDEEEVEAEQVTVNYPTSEDYSANIASLHINGSVTNPYTGAKQTYYDPDVAELSGMEALYEAYQDYQTGFGKGIKPVLNSDGIWVLPVDGQYYVIVAADAGDYGLYSRGDIVQTSLGVGVVYDCCGEAAGTRMFDIATNWVTGRTSPLNVDIGTSSTSTSIPQSSPNQQYTNAGNGFDVTNDLGNGYNPWLNGFEPTNPYYGGVWKEEVTVPDNPYWNGNTSNLRNVIYPEGEQP